MSVEAWDHHTNTKEKNTMSMPIEVVGMAEAAQIVGVSKSNFSAHRAKHSGENECPEPTAVLTCGPVWVGSDVKQLHKWADRFSKVRVTRAPAQAKNGVEHVDVAASKVKATKPASKTAKAAKPKVAKSVTKAPAKVTKAASPKKESAVPAPAAAPKKGLFKS